MAYHIEGVRARALSVPLIDPFVIASGRVDATRAALVEADVVDERTGRRATGLGEAAALPPVTAEDQPDILHALAAFAPTAAGRRLDGDPDEVTAWLDGDAALGGRPVARAGVETAVLDALARLRGVALFRLLANDFAGPFERRLVSDITVPIHEPAYMGELAGGWRARGFTCFKVKVGLDLERDVAGMRAIRERVPDATFRVDANGGYAAREAVELYERSVREGCAVECFEQPCAKGDLDGMAAVTAALPVPVVADESVASVEDVERLVARRAAGGVNLKVVKMRGPLGAAAAGRRARELGLAVMCGAMVETRLGITAAAHVCVAVGGVRFVDLDTAWLLREDPFEGGYRAEGPRYEVPDEAGLALAVATGGRPRSPAGATR